MLSWLAFKPFAKSNGSLWTEQYKVYQRLKAIDIEAKDKDRLKSLAVKNYSTPIKLMRTILVEESQIE